MRTVLAIPADEHCMSTLGLMPPGQFPLSDGGGYSPSFAQSILLKQWDECWERVAQLRKRSRLIVVNNGDAIEGKHHGSTAIGSSRIEEHEAAFANVFDRGLQIAKFKRGDSIYFTRGTSSHTGSGAESEERIAEDFDAVKISERHSQYQLLIRINGQLFDIAHHGPSAGTRNWTRGNTLFYTIRTVYIDALEYRQPIPRVWVRSHYHQWVPPPRFIGEHGQIEGFLTPSFQFMTGYAHRATKGVPRVSTVGMLIFIIEDNGDIKWECPRLSRPVVKIQDVK